MPANNVTLPPCRPHLPPYQVVLTYPPDAKEIFWQNGQPVQRPYRGPSQLRMEQDFSPAYDIRLAATSWAKAHFEVLHAPAQPLGAEWADATLASSAEGVPAALAAEHEHEPAAALAAADAAEPLLLAEQPEAMLGYLAPAAHLQFVADAAVDDDYDEALPVPLLPMAEELGEALQQPMGSNALLEAALEAAAPGAPPIAAAPAQHYAPPSPLAAAAALLAPLETGAGSTDMQPPAASQPSAEAGGASGAASLCASPSGELCTDGHLRPPCG